MYSYLLLAHSWVRWAVVLTVLLTLAASLSGWVGRRPYTRTDTTLRSLSTSFVHLQLILGFILYFKSPITTYFRENARAALANSDITFFGLIHFLLMFVAVVVFTIGSSMGKRAKTDALKHQTVALYFLVGTLLIFVAIPWPFSPLAQRPLFRPF
ncbi:MAG: hypothetical protein EAZ91_15460 [Cytophagales bacterium]|nr:MAG: hypothetical protein EAZ91_15460 [Cytophagales bacterium]